MKSRFGFVATLLLCPLCIRAQTTVSWESLISGNWSNSGSWLFGQGPATGDIVTFQGLAAGTSIVDETIAIGGLQTNFLLVSPLTITATAGNYISLQSGATIFQGSAAALNLFVPIEGAGNLSLDGGTGVVTLNPGTRSNTYSGTTQIFGGGRLADGEADSYSPNSIMFVGGTGGGTLDVNFNEAIASLGDGGANGSVVIAGGATLDLVGGYTGTFSGVISGAGNLEKDVTGTLILLGANTYTGSTVINGAGGTAIELGNGGTTGSIASGSVSGTGTLAFDRSNAYVYPGALSGALQVAQSGTGTTTLSGLDTYSGATTVSNGTLQAGSTSAFGGATGLSFVTVNASGTLALNGFNNIVGWLSGSGTVSLGSSTLTVAYPTSSTSFSGLITGAGGSLVSAGQTLVLSGGNTYSGTTTIDSGSTLIADNSSGSATGTGPVVIASGGTLQVGPGGEMPLGIITNSSISNGGTLSFADSSNQTYGGNISGAGVLNQFGNGMLTLSGNNSFSGFTQVEFGVLAAGSTTAFGGAGNSDFTLESGGILDLSVFSNSIGSIQGDSTTLIDIGGGAVLTIAGSNRTSPFMGTIQGGGGLNLIGVNAVTTLSGANSYTGGTTIATGFLVADNAAGSATGTGNITVDPVAILQIGNSDTSGSVAAPNITNNGTIELARTDSTTLASNISGTGGISMLSSGNFTLTGSNSYSGPTFIVGGTLTAGSSTAFGNGLTAVDIIGGGTLSLGGFANSVGSIAGDSTAFIKLGTGELITGALNTVTTFGGVISGAGILEVVGSSETILTGANTFTGGVSIPGTGGTLSIGNGATPGASIVSNVMDGGTLIFAPATSDNLTYAGAISGGGVVTFFGPGSTTLSGANTYLGITNVFGGTLSDGAANSFSPDSRMLVNSGAGVAVNFDETVADIENGGSGGLVSIASGATLTSRGTFDVGDFEGTISGNGAFAVSGGVQGLSGNNTYSGGTSVSGGGELFVGSNTALGTGTLTIFPGTEMSPDASITLANAIVLNGGATLDNDDGGPNSLTLTGPISEVGGSGNIEWCTTATLALTNANTFTGGVDMREGTLLLGNDSGAGTGTITLDANTVLSAFGSGITLSIANPINVTGSPAQIGALDNNFITITGPISGEASLVYSGGTNGTLTLTGANNGFSGPFTINSGTVFAGNDNAFGASANPVSLTGGAALNVMNGVTVSNPLTFTGAPNTLEGNGTIASAVTVDNHLVLAPSSPTNGPGNLTFNNSLTFANGGAISFDLYNATGAPGTGYSLISANTGLNITAGAGSLTFNLFSTDINGNSASAINFNPASSYSWTFLLASPSVTGFNTNEFNINTAGFTNGGGGTFSITGTTNSLSLNFSPVPEPSTWALVGTGVFSLALLSLRRRRTSRA